jgi:hypothetical protein
MKTSAADGTEASWALFCILDHCHLADENDAHTSLAQRAGPLHTQFGPHDYKPGSEKAIADDSGGVFG